MQLDNESPWAAALVPGWGLQHKMQMTCIVKMAFQWDEHGDLSPLPAEQHDICYQDEYANDDPETGSIVQASDTCPFKEGFEWLLKGSVKPKANATQQVLSVAFHHPNWRHEKKIVAIGPRVWKKSIFGLVPSEPKALTELPITYELAFGGRYSPDGEKTIQYDANPVGKGFYKARDKQQATPVELPAFETLPLMSSTKSQPTPAGFNALTLTWSGRDEAFKKLDSDAAAEGRCPYPTVIPKALYNSAPLDQRYATAPPPGTKVQLTGFDANSVTIELPDEAERIRLLKVTQGKVEKISPKLDTLLIDTDAKTIALVYRCAIPWHPIHSPISQLRLTEKSTISEVETSATARVSA